MTRLPATIAAVLALTAGPALAQQGGNPTDTGTVSIAAATSAPFVEVTMGAPASLTGSLGGSIANNTPEGTAMLGLAIALGEIGPGNSSAFVLATVPFRLRSNAGYAVTMQVTSFSNFLPADPRNVQLSDFGFGLAPPARAGVGALIPAVDTVGAGALNDPTSGGAENASTGHWTYGHSLASYQSAVTVLSGPRIVRAVPKSVLGGLYVNARYCVKPQWFTPGNVLANITFTTVTP